MPPTGIIPYDQGDYDYVIGVDEVGFGSWAGPVTVGMVALPRDWKPTPGTPIGDSKALTPTQRETAYASLMKDTRIFYRVFEATNLTIDQDGVGPVLRQLHEDAVYEGRKALLERFGKDKRVIAIVDGIVRTPGAFCLPKADSLIPAVSAASILAKVWRDRQMTEYEKTYPGYDFAGAKGYGTPRHQAGLKKLGVCALHRKSYSPIANMIAASKLSLV